MPVPGIVVDDFAGTVERLTVRGVQWLTEPDVPWQPAAPGVTTAPRTATSTR